MNLSVFKFLKKLVQKALKDDCLGLASEMAFNFLLSLFPFAILIFAIFGVFGGKDVIYQLIEITRVIAPSDALNLVEEVLKSLLNTSSGKILTLSIVGTAWTASNSIISLMKGLNRVYGIEETRPIWKTRFISVFMLIITAIILILGSNLIIFTGVIVNFIDKLIPLSTDISTFILIIRWPVAFLSLFILILLLYSYIPNADEPKSEITKLKESVPGALFFCMFWLFASWGFSMYVENFGKYNAIYGSLGAVVVLLVWLYYTSFIILLGAEINSLYSK